jgi:hypothetical protein
MVNERFHYRWILRHHSWIRQHFPSLPARAGTFLYQGLKGHSAIGFSSCRATQVEWRASVLHGALSRTSLFQVHKKDSCRVRLRWIRLPGPGRIKIHNVQPTRTHNTYAVNRSSTGSRGSRSGTDTYSFSSIGANVGALTLLEKNVRKEIRVRISFKFSVSVIVQIYSQRKKFAASSINLIETEIYGFFQCFKSLSMFRRKLRR